MRTPLVSIIVPCYNSEQWIRETIDCALAQTWPNKEIIVVDDGSSDRSYEIAKAAASSRVQVIRQPNQGASAARNRALQTAQGDLIQYLDADDLLASDKIERQVQRLTQHGLDYVAAGEWARFYNIPYHQAIVEIDSLWADRSPVDWLVFAWQSIKIMHPGAWLVPRAIHDRAGGWNETLSFDDDGEYFCRVLLASQGIKFCWGARSYYRSGLANSLSQGQSRKAFSSFFRALQLRTQCLQAVEDSERVRLACANFFQHLAYETYLQFPDIHLAAQMRAKQLGGANTQLQGGKMLQFCSKILGWRQAKQIHHWVTSLGYSRESAYRFR